MGGFPIGQDAALAQWRRAGASGRLHHAWLLTGRRGLGKAAFAHAAARELVAEPGTAQPDPHPDILHLNRAPKDDKEADKQADGKPFETARNIKIDQIRRLQRRLDTRPTMGARRAVVIDPADDLEAGAANALLKSLEEPPAGTVFLLVAHNPGGLLPTIRSRCRVLRFVTPGAEAVARTLAQVAPDADPQARDAAMAAANGVPGAALAFLEAGLGKAFGVMERIVADGDPHLAGRAALASAIGPRPSRETQGAAIALARTVLSQALRGAGRGQWPGIVDAHAALLRLGAEAPTYNYDPGLLVQQIGTLLARAAPPRA